jgi:hypothetical protein
MTSGMKRDCGRCESPLERGDLRCPICAQAVPGATDEREQLEIEVLRCEGCGAAVEYDVKAQAPRCPFCGATTHVETIEDPMEKAEGYLPFLVEERSARSALGGWLGSLGFFRPSDLKAGATVESLKALYWVGWLFDAEALASWTADTNAGARRANWAPCSGQASVRFEQLAVSASRGLSDEETASIVGGYRVETTVAEPAGADRPVVEKFEVQRSLARRRILAGLDSAARQRIENECLPGKRHRKLHVALLLRRLVTRRLAFPAWVMAYRYRGKAYRAVICGQDASLVVGSAPYSIWKILGVIGFAAAAVAGIVALLLASQ